MQLRDVVQYLLNLPRPLYLLAAGAMTVALFLGGSQPFAVGLFSAPYDKLAHSLYFAALGVLFWFGFGGRWPVLLFVAVSAIGGLDELHQAMLPGRQAGLDDFLTDTVAAGLAIAVLAKYKAVLGQLRYRKNAT